MQQIFWIGLRGSWKVGTGARLKARLVGQPFTVVGRRGIDSMTAQIKIQDGGGAVHKKRNRDAVHKKRDGLRNLG